MADFVNEFAPALAGLAALLALGSLVAERAIGMRPNQMVGFSILFGFLALLVIVAYRYGMNDDHDHEH